jgi:hypothetical protein
MLLLPTTVLGRYEATELIALCTQADMYKGIDRTTGHAVAIKRLATSRDQPHFAIERARFERAGRLRIPHPVIVNPIDLGAERGEFFAITPFIVGLDLDVYTARAGGAPAGCRRGAYRS